MRNKTIGLMLAAFAIALFAAGTSMARGGHEATPVGTLGITLSPLPSAKGTESGLAEFSYDKNDGIRYTLRVNDVENATMGHIHEVGDNGTPGAILAWIYPTKGESPTLKAGNFSGKLARGEITADRLEGPLKGKSTKQLFEMLHSGKAGVALHTKQNPGGELWGYLKPGEHKM